MLCEIVCSPIFTTPLLTTAHSALRPVCPGLSIRVSAWAGHRGVKIGNNVSIFSNVTLGGLGHTIFHHGKSGYPIIGNNVILYTNVTVLGPVKIGDNTAIGAHSLVLKSIPKNCLAAGNPVKIIKNNNSQK